ncbi:hypothetical protein PTKIN_Ptkin11bG0099000 [Pterospermum kingtungense]
MNEALVESPWTVMRCCLNLKKWEIGQAIQDICFQKVSFWVQVHKTSFGDDY